MFLPSQNIDVGPDRPVQEHEHSLPLVSLSRPSSSEGDTNSILSSSSHQPYRLSQPNYDSSDDEDDEQMYPLPSLVTVLASISSRPEQIIVSPYTGLKYDMTGLDPSTSATVRDVFARPSRLPLTLTRCRLRDAVYEFEMTELIHRTVRIGPDETMQLTATLCEHEIWLMDQVTKHGLYHIDPAAPLPMGPTGRAIALGSAYKTISRFHLDLLAARLNCPVAPSSPSQSEPAIDPWRLTEIRKMLWALSPTHASTDWGSYRPDIFDQVPIRLGHRRVKRGDLESTIFRMLYHDDEFFHNFRSHMPRDQTDNRFQRLETQIFYVFQLHDAYRSAPAASPPVPPESSCDVRWAKFHIKNAVREIKTEVERTNTRLGPRERRSAVDTLVYILGKVVEYHDNENDMVEPHDHTQADTHGNVTPSLYWQLIGGKEDGDFVIGALAGLSHEALPFVHQLGEVFETVLTNQAPAQYIDRFHAFLDRLRNLEP